jgi:hypothetical protein
LYDVSGRLARVLATGPGRPGVWSVTIAASDFPCGVYLLRLQTEDSTVARKLIIE